MSKVINEVAAAMNAHDLDTMIRLIHPEYTSVQPAHPDREFGSSAQVRANWGAMFAGVPDFRASSSAASTTAAPAGASGDGRATATTASVFDMRGITLFDIADGRIIAGRLYMEHVEHGGGGIAQSVIAESGVPPQTTA